MTKRNPIAKDLRTSKYRKRVVEDKHKEKLEEILDEEMEEEVEDEQCDRPTDMLYEECIKCGEGEYVEKSIWCDWRGEPLSCSKCNHRMPRYSKHEEGI